MFSENYQRQTALGSVQQALDPSLTDHELATLARSDEAKVRAAVGERAATPLTVLLRLAEDESPAVRAGVARNPRPDMPEDVFRDLSHDKSPEVVLALIGNEAVPDSIIARIARNRTKDYSVEARQRLAARGKGAKSRVLGMVGITQD